MKTSISEHCIGRGMKREKRIVVIVLACGMLLALGIVAFVIMRQNDSTSVVSSPVVHPRQNPEVVQSSVDKQDGDESNAVTGKRQMVRTMRFLEIARQFIAEDQRAEIDKTIAAGVDALPDGFAKFSAQHMDFFGYLKNKGVLLKYYDALKKEFLRSKGTADINVLKFLVAIASIPSLKKQDEYSTWLNELFLLDTHPDVAFLVAEMKTFRGSADEAIRAIRISSQEHPRESSGLYLNALRLFAESKASVQMEEVLSVLKDEQRLDSLACMMGGDIMSKVERNTEAEQFYQKALVRLSDKDEGIKGLCRVRQLRSIVKSGKEIPPSALNELRDLANDAEMPIERLEARQLLISLNADFTELNSNRTN